MNNNSFKKIIIQIPVFNEENFIENTLKSIPSNICNTNEIKIVIIDDGSTDKTIEKIKNLNFKNLYILRLPKHYGLGRAFREGLKFALKIDFDIIVNIDADNQYPGCEIYKIVKPILENKADMVIGDRQLTKIKDYPVYKLFWQKIGNIFISLLFGKKIDDSTSGFRGFSKKAAVVLVESLKDDYTYTIESLCVALLRKIRILYVPVSINHIKRKSHLITNKLFYVTHFIKIVLQYFLKRQCLQLQKLTLKKSLQ